MGNVKPTRNEVHPNSNYIVSLTQLSLHLGGIGRQTLDKLLASGMNSIRRTVINTTVEYWLKDEVDEWIEQHSKFKEEPEEQPDHHQRIQTVSTARARVRNK